MDFNGWCSTATLEEGTLPGALSSQFNHSVDPLFVRRSGLGKQGGWSVDKGTRGMPTAISETGKGPSHRKYDWVTVQYHRMYITSPNFELPDLRDSSEIMQYRIVHVYPSNKIWGKIQTKHDKANVWYFCGYSFATYSEQLRNDV